MVTMKTSALDRLSAEQKIEVANLAASFRMEGMEPTPTELELGARYLLDELTFDELQSALSALR